MEIGIIGDPSSFKLIRDSFLNPPQSPFHIGTNKNADHRCALFHKAFHAPQGKSHPPLTTWDSEGPRLRALWLFANRRGAEL